MQHDQKPIHRLDLVQLGSNIRKARDDKGLTREQLAEATGLSPGFIGEIEFARKGPSVGTLYVLAQALDTTMDDLARPAGEPKPLPSEKRRLKGAQLEALRRINEEVSLLTDSLLVDWKDEWKKD